MKLIKIDLKSIISDKYLMPEKMLIASLERINLAIPQKKFGRKRSYLARILQGNYYVLRTGIQWEALPFIFGQSKTVYY